MTKLNQVCLVAAVLVASCVSCVGSNHVKNRHIKIGLQAETASIASVTTVSTARAQWEHGADVRRLGRHAVALPAVCSETRARQLMANVRFVLEMFEEDHGEIERSLLIFITDRPEFYMELQDPMRRHILSNWPVILPPPAVVKLSLVGIYCGPNEIAVIAGRDDCLPALYHEFCHADLPDAGGDHRNPLWKTWNERGDELASRIRNRWR